MKPSTSPMESPLNLFSVDIEANGPSPVNGNDNQTSTSKNKTNRVTVQKESESQDSGSNDQQSPRPSAEGISEQDGSSPIKPNTENVNHAAEGDTGQANILEEIYDEDLQYIFNITHNLDTMSLNNETHDELDAERPSPEDTIDMKDLADDAETARSDRKIEKENLMKEDNGVKTRIIVGDLLTKRRESATGEQRKRKPDSIVNNHPRIGADVSGVTYPTEMTTDQNDKDDDDIRKKGGSLEISNMNISVAPCNNFHCKRGKMCKADGDGNPFCACQDPENCLPSNKNDLVCGTDNKTYTSVCHLFGTKCHLEGTKEGIHLHLDYQGPCKYIPPCTEYEFAHFPFRMRDWLRNVLMQLYERDQGTAGILSDKQRSKLKKIYENEKRLQDGHHNIELLVRDFQKNYHMYVYPVHWQFHQLDQHIMDRLLTHSELAALRAPLIPNEHCVNAFLQKCNTNNDRHISLWEWGRCFGIQEGDIDEDLLF